jgi:hypothetical protein
MWPLIGIRIPIIIVQRAVELEFAPRDLLYEQIAEDEFGV